MSKVPSLLSEYNGIVKINKSKISLHKIEKLFKMTVFAMQFYISFQPRSLHPVVIVRPGTPLVDGD